MNDEGQTFGPKDVYRQLAEEQARGAALPRAGWITSGSELGAAPMAAAEALFAAPEAVVPTPIERKRRPNLRIVDVSGAA